MDDQNQELNKLVNKIVEAVRPEQVILFGSAARGDLTAQSDYDFLIVMPDGIHKRQTAQHLYKVLAETGSSVDILVTEKSDLERHKKNIGLIYKTALEEGRILYAARTGRKGKSRGLVGLRTKRPRSRSQPKVSGYLA